VFNEEWHELPPEEQTEGSRLGWDSGQGVDLGCPNVERLFKLFTSCLKDVMFPGAWKKTRLILLRKENKPAKSPSAYRPIYLLDDVGKLLEQLVAGRLWINMDSERGVQR